VPVARDVWSAIEDDVLAGNNVAHADVTCDAAELSVAMAPTEANA
jgi:hypothetical protein